MPLRGISCIICGFRRHAFGVNVVGVALHTIDIRSAGRAAAAPYALANNSLRVKPSLRASQFDSAAK